MKIVKLLLLPIPVEFLFTAWRVVQSLQVVEVRMTYGLLNGQTLLVRESQQSFQKIDSLLAGMRYPLFPVDRLFALLQLQLALTFYEDACLRIVDYLEIFVVRHAQQLKDHDYFIGIRVTWEKHRSLHELRKYTACRPHVETLIVRLVEKTHLGRSVPSCDHVGRLFEYVFNFAKSSAETKVANFEITLGIDKNVGRLQISVHDVRSVHVIYSSHDLIHEVLVMVRLQFLPRIDKLMQICLHQLRNNVHVIVVSPRWRPLNIYQLNDVFVVKEFYISGKNTQSIKNYANNV